MKNNENITKEEIIKIIIKYEKELHDDYVEMRDEYGSTDRSTKRCCTQWLVMDELLSRLEMKDED
jgi:hypothetical protein